MTNEEKARAYDEALKDMRVIYPNLRGDAKLAVEHAFPQLAESEDERIRKYIVDFVKLEKGVNLPPDDADRMLAYLEKQKEQKTAEWSYPYGRNKTVDRLVSLAECLEMDGDCLFNEHTGKEYGKFLRELARKQIEYKPEEWDEEDEKMLKWLCRIIHSRVVNKELSLAEASELGKWIDKWINHEPQHEKEWSEFDEYCLRRAIWYVENPAPSVVKDTNLVLWLKSLPLNLKKKNEDVARKEE